MTDLGQLAAERDGAAFVGRDQELGRLEDLLIESSNAVIGYVHGPGGIGKTALLRELARRAERAGRTVVPVDGRDIGTAADVLDAALQDVTLANPSLILLDGFEHMSALSPHLRDHLLAALPDTARVVVASRQPPEAGWRSSSWGTVLTVVGLDPLPVATAEELLQRRGVTDPEQRSLITTWAGGLPLALAVAAETDAKASGSSPLELDARLAGLLLDQVVGSELGDGDPDVLAVAAIAHQVDARTLAAVLPGLDADQSFSWLRERSFVEVAGSQAVLHERIAAAIRAELRLHRPEHERHLRWRILEHLYQRIVLGEPWLALGLPLLGTDPAFRYGVGAVAPTVRSDRLRRGDVDALRTAVQRRGEVWSPATERWLLEAPEHVVVLREGEDVVGLGVGLTLSWMPAWAGEDPLVGRWLAAMEDGSLPASDVMMLRDSYDLHTAPGAAVSEVLTVGNEALMRRSGLPNARAFVVACRPRSPEMEAFMDSMGYQRAPGLDLDEDGRLLETHLSDQGPGGMAHTLRSIVLADLGMSAPAPAPAPQPQAAAAALRDALRSYHDPQSLAASPLAHGPTAPARADSVRRLVADGLEDAFGSSEDEQLQRHVIELGYLDPRGGHAAAARALHLSRTTYFRRLSRATDRLAQAVVERRVGGKLL